MTGAISPVRLLLIKTSSLGDVVHALPALSDAALALPNLRVDWVVEEAFAPIAALHTSVDRVIPVAIRRWRRQPFSSGTWSQWGQFRSQLQEHCYDLVLDAQGLAKSAFLAIQARGPRAGLNWASAREPLSSLAYRFKYPVNRGLHAISRNRLLMAQALGYLDSNARLSDSPPRYGVSVKKVLGSQKIFCFHGSARQEKCWSKDRWVALGTALSRQGHVLVFPSGNASEFQEARAIVQAIIDNATASAALPLAPEPMPLKALISQLSEARAVIGVDTGLLHLSAAMGRPGIGMFVSTDPLQFGALPESTATPFVNLGKEESRSPERVHRAVESILS